MPHDTSIDFINVRIIYPCNNSFHPELIHFFPSKKRDTYNDRIRNEIDFVDYFECFY